MMSRMTPSLPPAAHDSSAAHVRTRPTRSSPFAPGQRRPGPDSSSTSAAIGPDGAGPSRDSSYANAASRGSGPDGAGPGAGSGAGSGAGGPGGGPPEEAGGGGP